MFYYVYKKEQVQIYTCRNSWYCVNSSFVTHFYFLPDHVGLKSVVKYNITSGPRPWWELHLVHRYNPAWTQIVALPLLQLEHTSFVIVQKWYIFLRLLMLMLMLMKQKFQFCPLHDIIWNRCYWSGLQYIYHIIMSYWHYDAYNMDKEYGAEDSELWVETFNICSSGFH